MQQSPYFYLAPTALTIKLNSLNGDPQNAAVGVAPNTRIRLSNEIPDGEGNITVIGYDNSLEYKTWRINSRNAHFADSTIGKDIHMYAMLPQNSDRGSLAYTTSLLDINGTPSPDSTPDAIAPEGFYYIHLATFAYDSTTNQRTLSFFDTGILKTQKQTNDLQSGGDWNKVFSWNSVRGWLQMIAPFYNILFKNGDDEMVNITSIRTSTETNVSEDDHSLATTGFVGKFFAKLEWVKDNFLSKTSDDTTPHTLHVGELHVEKGLDIPEEEGTSTGHLRVDGDINAEHDARIANNLSVGKDSTFAGDAEFNGERNAFAKGVEMGSDLDPQKSYERGVRGCKIFWNGSGWEVETDYLSVNKKMYAKEIEVDKVTHVGGEQILTAASCYAEEVVPVVTNDMVVAWRVFFRRKDAEGRSVTNDWQVGDLAYCQTFNIEEGTTADFSNRYYWRAVIGVGHNDEFNYIVLSNAEGQYDAIGCADEENSPSIQSRLGSDEPQMEDHIIQFGFDKYLARRNGNNVDDATAKERAGATLVSGSGRYSRSIIMWDNIITFTIPKPRLLISPQKVDMSVDTLRIRVGEGQEKTVEEIVEGIDLDARIVINGDDEREPTTDAAFMRLLLIAVFGEEEADEHDVRELLGAVYITTEKMFYMLTEREDGTLTWMDETDGTLRLLYDKYEAMREEMESIFDDGIITYDEKLQLWTLYKQLLSNYDAVRLSFRPPYSTSPTIIDAYSQFFSSMEALFMFFEDMVGVKANQKPRIGNVYFSDAANAPEDADIIPYTRKDMVDMVNAFTTAYGNYQTAMSDYKVNSIAEAAAEQAQQNAIDYVNEHLDNILDQATKNTVNGWIRDYTNNRFVTTSVFEAEKGELKAYTQWIDEFDPSHIGGAGMWANLQRMFVGTQAIQFDEKGEVVNFSKNGLATDEQIVALTSRITDVDGKVISQSEIAMWIEDSFSSSANAHTLKSHMLFVADDIQIESGSKTFGDYFSVKNGNVWCQNITLEGVLNSLVNDITEGSPRLIPTDSDGNGGYIYDSLDILNTGDVINFKSSNGRNILLPYYINEVMNSRTLTRYGGTLHRITPTELRQLVGRRITIFIDKDCETEGAEGGIYIMGCHYFEPYAPGALEHSMYSAIADLANGTPIFALPTSNEDWGIRLQRGKVAHLEFRIVNMHTGRSIFPAYVWVKVEAEDTFPTVEDTWEEEIIEPER